MNAGDQSVAGVVEAAVIGIAEDKAAERVGCTGASDRDGRRGRTEVIVHAARAIAFAFRGPGSARRHGTGGVRILAVRARQAGVVDIRGVGDLLPRDIGGVEQRVVFDGHDAADADLIETDLERRIRRADGHAGAAGHANRAGIEDQTGRDDVAHAHVVSDRIAGVSEEAK